MTGAVSKTDAGVNPRAQLTLILLWAIFDLLACAGFAVLLAIGLLTRRGKNNPVLLSLFAVFLLATASGPLLTWTGYAMSMDVPAGLCLVSGAFGSSWSAAQVSSAFALVLKVGQIYFLLCSVAQQLFVCAGLGTCPDARSPLLKVTQLVFVVIFRE
jgi:hypothetical protein